MTGIHQGVTTWIQWIDNTGFMQVWCDTHQLDLSMQPFYLAIPDTFKSTFTSLVSYLIQKQNFILDERIQCPIIKKTSG